MLTGKNNYQLKSSQHSGIRISKLINFRFQILKKGKKIN